MKQFLLFVRKEFKHVFRDRKTLLILFGLPIAQILLFGFALTNEIKNTKVVVCDFAKDAASQQIIQKIAASDEFVVEQAILDPKDIDRVLKDGQVKMVLVFPSNFENDLLHLNAAQVQLITDASDPNTATTINNYVSRIIMEYQMELLAQRQLPYQIDTEVRMVYNPELKAAINFVPGVISLVLLLVCVLMTSVSIVKEKELGTMEILLVSPFNPILVIISKAVPYLILSIVNLTIILLLSVTIMGMPINGSILLLYAVSTLFIITSLSLGLLISNSTSSQQAAMMISLVGMLVPSILFTGFMFPLENMPYALQLISHIVPAKWFYIIIKAVMVKGLGITAIWQETLVLAGMTTLLLLINIKKFKVRLA